MGNGVNLTDGLDGLAGGTAALAFIAMSIAVLPICSGLYRRGHLLKNTKHFVYFILDSWFHLYRTYGKNKNMVKAMKIWSKP